MKASARPVIRSEGQRQLAALGRKRLELAAVLGVTSQYVSQLITGRVRPSLDLAHRIERRIGILMQAWCELPTKAALSLERSTAEAPESNVEKTPRDAA